MLLFRVRRRTPLREDRLLIIAIAHAGNAQHYASTQIKCRPGSTMRGQPPKKVGPLHGVSRGDHLGLSPQIAIPHGSSLKMLSARHMRGQKTVAEPAAWHTDELHIADCGRYIASSNAVV